MAMDAEKPCAHSSLVKMVLMSKILLVDGF